MRPSASQSRLIHCCGDLAVEVVAAKAEAEWVVASALLTDPTRMAEARAAGLRRHHFADEDLNMLVAIVNEVKDTSRAVVLFSTWLGRVMKWKQVRPDGSWTAGRWTCYSLARFALSDALAPSLGEWVEQLIKRTRALNRAARAESVMFRALSGVKAKRMMGPIHDAIWIQKAAIATGYPIEMLTAHVFEKRAGVDRNKIPRRPWRGIPTLAFAGGDKQSVRRERTAVRKTA
jgi:hypothetical protein